MLRHQTYVPDAAMWDWKTDVVFGTFGARTSQIRCPFRHRGSRCGDATAIVPGAAMLRHTTIVPSAAMQPLPTATARPPSNMRSGPSSKCAHRLPQDDQPQTKRSKFAQFRHQWERHMLRRETSAPDEAMWDWKPLPTAPARCLPNSVNDGRDTCCGARLMSQTRRCRTSDQTSPNPHEN